jgi:hypothetical protein
MSQLSLLGSVPKLQNLMELNYAPTRISDDDLFFGGSGGGSVASTKEGALLQLDGPVVNDDAAAKKSDAFVEESIGGNAAEKNIKMDQSLKASLGILEGTFLQATTATTADPQDKNNGSRETKRMAIDQSVRLGLNIKAINIFGGIGATYQFDQSLPSQLAWKAENMAAPNTYGIIGGSVPLPSVSARLFGEINAAKTAFSSINTKVVGLGLGSLGAIAYQNSRETYPDGSGQTSSRIELNTAPQLLAGIPVSAKIGLSMLSNNTNQLDVVFRGTF